MTTDHSIAIEHLIDAADEAMDWRLHEVAAAYRASADALEALTTKRSITINETAVEGLAFWMLRGQTLYEGSPKGHLARERAREFLEAAWRHQNPEGDQT